MADGDRCRYCGELVGLHVYLSRTSCVVGGPYSVDPGSDVVVDLRPVDPEGVALDRSEQLECRDA